MKLYQNLIRVFSLEDTKKFLSNAKFRKNPLPKIILIVGVKEKDIDMDTMSDIAKSGVLYETCKTMKDVHKRVGSILTEIMNLEINTVMDDLERFHESFYSFQINGKSFQLTDLFRGDTNGGI